MNHACLFFFLFASAAAGAQELNQRFDTTLSLRFDEWSGSRQLDDVVPIAQVSVWGRAKLGMDAAGAIVGSGWLRGQSPGDGDVPHSRLRELYWRYSNGPVELRIGRQMVVWGRADGLNPTDNLSPRDFRLLAPEDSDLRYGNEAAQVSIDSRIGTLSGLYFPHAASHNIPLEPFPNVSYVIEGPPQRSQWALKWDARGDGIDGSLSYFHGIDPTPDLSLAGLQGARVEIAVRNNAARILGGDFSLARNGVIWRGEIAWMETDRAGADDFTRKRPQIWLVGGGEWTLKSNTTLGIQGTLQRVMHFQSPNSIANPVESEVAWRQAATSNQTAAMQSGMTWRLATRWRNDTLLVETSGVVILPSASGIWRAKMDYALTDHWHWQVGGDHYFGPQHSFFGQLSKNRLLYAQVRYAP